MLVDSRGILDQGSAHPPVLLGQVSVMSKVGVELILLVAQVGDPCRNTPDFPHKRVLEPKACRAGWTYIRTIRTLHT